MISRAFDIVSRRIDGPLMAALALTLALGLTVVYSASGASLERLGAQGRNLAIALLALWMFAHIPPQTLMRFAVPIWCYGSTPQSLRYEDIRRARNFRQRHRCARGRLVPGEGRRNIFSDAGVFRRNGLSVHERVTCHFKSHSCLRYRRFRC